MKPVGGLAGAIQAVVKTLGIQLRPVMASMLAFCFYQQALPGPIFVYWVMFFVTVAGALALSRFVQFIEHLIGPDCSHADE